MQGSKRDFKHRVFRNNSPRYVQDLSAGDPPGVIASRKLERSVKDGSWWLPKEGIVNYEFLFEDLVILRTSPSGLEVVFPNPAYRATGSDVDWESGSKQPDFIEVRAFKMVNLDQEGNYQEVEIAKDERVPILLFDNRTTLRQKLAPKKTKNPGAKFKSNLVLCGKLCQNPGFP